MRVIPPEGDKHYMIGFDATSLEEARAYNETIAHYLGSLNSTIFHQVGRDDEPGYHAWEIWDREVDGQKLEALLPEIERDAQILIMENDLGILYEKVYKRWEEQKK